ncbi:MAG: DUF255 domain-containing protein [Chthoniobacteraceae bacterium]
MKGLIFIACLLLGQLAFCADAPKADSIEWQEWSPAVFERAKAEDKLVLLNLHAVWCHWCHVMDQRTYSNPKVIALIRSKYIAVSVDQDSRPDLSNRYEDYGWPATVIFGSDGAELAKRRGFIAPEAMASTLQAFIDDPTPGPSVDDKEQKVQYSDKATLTDDQRKNLQAALVAGYDEKFGSWGRDQKYLDWNNVEYCITRAVAGDAHLEKMAKQTLTAQLQLIDPVWGGVYQYSTDGDWKHPHFEKIMQFQAEDIRTYALAYDYWKDPKDLQAASDIHRFVHDFLTDPTGTFYTSQDADVVDGEHSADYFKLDDAARRKQGVPRVDKHVYGRENGWMIYSLARLYAATGKEDYLEQALTAANCMLHERSMPSGGWRHDAENQAGPFLGDTLYMGRACLGLYEVTGDVGWLFQAEQAAIFIIDRHVPSEKAAGVVTTAISESSIVASRPEFDENVDVARFANLLYHYTDNFHYRDLAECAMRYISTPDIAMKRGAYTGGLLLADLELNSAPLHIVVVGSKKDDTAKKLFAAAVLYPGNYKQIEWQEPHTEALHKDIAYPDLPKAVAYICTNNSCSAPIFKPEELAARIDKLLAPRK